VLKVSKELRIMKSKKKHVHLGYRGKFEAVIPVKRVIIALDALVNNSR
jgi:hypothetical protein